ncbi:MAG: cytochrome P450 [Gemmatimonadaceae bacterium]
MFIPTVAKGVIIRRPRIVAIAERLQLDRKAVRCLQRLRRRYGDGPLLLDEIRYTGDDTTPKLPFLRACILESVRLWPTTPMILRQTNAVTSWSNGEMPANTGLLIYVPFFHRDEARLSFADSFTPERWLEEPDEARWPLSPFSAGPARCPGQQMVLLLTSLVLSSLLRDRELRLQPAGRLTARRPLPATLNNFSLRFTIHALEATRARSSAA